jgi:hypothetical protein
VLLPPEKPQLGHFHESLNSPSGTIKALYGLEDSVLSGFQRGFADGRLVEGRTAIAEQGQVHRMHVFPLRRKRIGGARNVFAGGCIGDPYLHPHAGDAGELLARETDALDRRAGDKVEGSKGSQSLPRSRVLWRGTHPSKPSHVNTRIQMLQGYHSGSELYSVG